MRRNWRTLTAGLLVTTLGMATTAQAESTDITVRVISHGAKFIGSSMDGAAITLEDARSGEVLASGVTRGGTGDTGRIMRPPEGRSPVIATSGAAAFKATLDLERPRLVKLIAEGPMSHPDSANRVTATQWVVPGKDLTGGNGWMVEMPGFVVDVLEPTADQTQSGLPAEVPLRVNVMMMCGCPIKPDGLWDANDYEVKALLYRDGERVGETTLGYAGRTSQFSGTARITETGEYEAIIYAYDPATGNTGLDKVMIEATP